jgi:hypothetical protein
MTDQEPRLQPGVTPGHHALLVEATAAATAYPGGPERLAQVIATGLAASRPRAAGRYLAPCCEEPRAQACCEEPEAEP